MNAMFKNGRSGAVATFTAPSAPGRGDRRRRRIFVATLALWSLIATTSVAAPGERGRPSPPPDTKPLVYDVENSGADLPAPTFPAFEDLEPIVELPNPFVPILGGQADASFDSWQQRRSEVMASIQHYEIGQRPPADDVEISATYAPGVLSVVIHRPSNGRRLVLTSAVHLPSGDGPFPAVITMSASPSEVRGRAPSAGPQGLGIPNEVWDGKGVARIDFYHDQLTTWAVGAGVPHRNDPYYQLYPEHYPPGEVGQYSAWSWGVSRLIDGIEIATRQSINPLPVRLGALATTGCSYGGKMSLFAGAFDERIALTIPQESGGGGIPAWRISHAIEPHGTVEKIDNTNYNWFREGMRRFSGDNVYRLPHDHHQLMALVAPRALLVTANTDMVWLSNRSGYASARAAERVYDTFDISDRFGYTFTNGYAHCVVPDHLRSTIELFIDKFLLGLDADTASVRIRPAAYDDPASPLYVDYARWQPWEIPTGHPRERGLQRRDSRAGSD